MSGSIMGADTNKLPGSKGGSNSKLSKTKAGKTNTVAASISKPATNTAPSRPELPKPNSPVASGGSNSVTKR